MATVNKPMNVKQREADVNRKLQLYGIFSAFQNGRLPSNEQVDIALNSFLASRGLSHPSAKLSPEGRDLVADFREVVNQAKYLLLSKNDGNLPQDFIWQTTQFDPDAINTPNAPVDKQTAQQHGDKALEGLKTLGTLIITNGQFRKLLSDATILLRDIAGDAASKAANKARPDKDKLAQIDQPADDHTWHDAPDLSKGNLKSQFQNKYKGNDPKSDVADAARNAASAAHPQGSSDPQDVAGTAANNPAALNPQSGLSAAKNTLQDRSDVDVEEKKELARSKKEEYKNRTREYLKQKMPEERRDQTIWRLKKMVIECQQHPDYQEAISTLLDLAEEYGGHAKGIAQGGTGTVQQTRSHMAQAEDDLKTLLERFANGTSSDDLWESIAQIYKDADQDPELKDWFKAMDRYVRRCLQEQGYILEDDSTEQWNRLYDHGNYLLRDKYRGHTDRVIDEVKFLADQFDQDAQNTAFANSLQKLFNDLGNDENGKPTFKPHLVKDLTNVIIPAVFESVSYIPIPRIEYTDPQIDAVIENLVLESDNFMPNAFEVFTENYVRWGRKSIANKSKHAVEVTVAGVQMDLRDINYYVKRKQGFPSIMDTGVADVKLAGDGFSFKLKLSTADAKDKQNFFKVDKVDVQMSHVNIKLTKSKHKLMFNMFKPIMLKVMRPALQKVAEKTIRDNFNKLDALAYRVKQEADRATEEVKEDPQNAPNIYSRYVSAFQSQMLAGKQKAQEKVADKKVNHAVTKEDSIFPNIHLEGGTTTKATEYKELARRGERWESPVFSIGSASRSSNIPSAPDVVRKPHSTSTPKPVTNGNAGYGNVGNTGDAGFNNASLHGQGTTNYSSSGQPTAY